VLNFEQTCLNFKSVVFLKTFFNVVVVVLGNALDTRHRPMTSYQNLSREDRLKYRFYRKFRMRSDTNICITHDGIISYRVDRKGHYTLHGDIFDLIIFLRCNKTTYFFKKKILWSRNSQSMMSAFLHLVATVYHRCGSVVSKKAYLSINVTF